MDWTVVIISTVGWILETAGVAESLWSPLDSKLCKNQKNLNPAFNSVFPLPFSAQHSGIHRTQDFLPQFWVNEKNKPKGHKEHWKHCLHLTGFENALNIWKSNSCLSWTQKLPSVQKSQRTAHNVDFEMQAKPHRKRKPL